MVARLVGGLVLALAACDGGTVAVPAPRTLDPPRQLAPALGPAGLTPPLFTWQSPIGDVDYHELELVACAGAVAACSFAQPDVRVAVSSPAWRSPVPRVGRHAWRVRACPPAGAACSPWSRPRWIDLGRAPADIDGDGKSEIAAGAPLIDLGGHDRGAVLVISSRGATVRIDEPAGADDAELGVAIAIADLDADGFADLIVGAPGTDGAAGRTYVYSGPGLGLRERAQAPKPAGKGARPAAGDRAADVPHRPALVLEAPRGRPDDWLGAALVAADFDGDGFVDVAVAAPGADGLRPGETDVGAVLIWRGGPAGLDPSPPRALTPPEPASFDGFGASLSAGDLDGDGYADLVVGVAGIDRAGRGRGTDRGAVYLYRGSGDGLFAIPTTRLEAPAPLDHDRFGYAVSAAGDLDGDGRADLAVGAPSSEGEAVDSGAVYLFTGPAALAGASPLSVLTADAASAGGGAYRRFGSAVAIVGDVDRDGLADLAVGTSRPDRGVALLYRGGREGIAATPWTVLRDPSPSAGSDFGDSLGGAGDIDGDGHADLVIGAASDRRGGRRGGSVLVYRGATGGVAEPRVIEGPAEQAHFGRSLAGR